MTPRRYSARCRGPDQVAITLPVEDGLAAADYVELAERCGHDAVLTGEVAGPKVFSLLGMIAAAPPRSGSAAASSLLRPAGFRATMIPPSPVPVLLAAMNPPCCGWPGGPPTGCSSPGRRRAALRLVGNDTVHALCAIGGPEMAADYVRALRSAGIDLPVVLTPGAEPGDVAGFRATITGVAKALGLSA